MEVNEHELVWMSIKKGFSPQKRLRNVALCEIQLDNMLSSLRAVCRQTGSCKTAQAKEGHQQALYTCLIQFPITPVLVFSNLITTQIFAETCLRFSNDNRPFFWFWVFFVFIYYFLSQNRMFLGGKKP